MAEYLTYPFKTMRITQTYNGNTSHKPHTTGNIKDFPIDEGGADSGRDAMYAPCDLKVVRIYGVGNSGTNTVWLESLKKVITPAGTNYVTIMATHSNDSDLRRLKTGDIINKGKVVCYEGTDGATGNHIHLSIAFGKIEGNGWKQNSKGKWVLTGTGKELKPEEAFYIDPLFTKVVSSGGLKFKNLPIKGYTTGNYRVENVTSKGVLRLRTGPATTYPYRKFNELSVDAQNKIKKYNNGKAANGYVAGVEFSVSEVKGKWGKTPSGWILLTYCVKL